MHLTSDQQPLPGRFHRENYDPFQKSSPGMLVAARILSTLSILFFWMIYLAVPLSSLAILLALLSRGGKQRIRHLRFVLLKSSIALIISISITGYAYYQVQTDPELHDRFQAIMEYYMDYYSVPTSSDPVLSKGGDAV